jgi:ADP-ribose pyrophosphatase YjhB (NUDIX family)
MQKGVDYTGISVVTLCHDGEGRYLLEYRSDKCRDEHFTWSPVGSGGVKIGERLEDAVRREVKEECGADASEIEFLGYREVFRKIGDVNTHWIAFDFRAKIDPEMVSIMEPEKCLRLEWFKFQEFPEPRHSQFPIFLEQHRDRL